jgi:hypothetical protein
MSSALSDSGNRSISSHSQRKRTRSFSLCQVMRHNCMGAETLEADAIPALALLLVEVEAACCLRLHTLITFMTCAEPRHWLRRTLNLNNKPHCASCIRPKCGGTVWMGSPGTEYPDKLRGWARRGRGTQTNYAQNI